MPKSLLSRILYLSQYKCRSSRSKKSKRHVEPDLLRVTNGSRCLPFGRTVRQMSTKWKPIQTQTRDSTSPSVRPSLVCCRRYLFVSHQRRPKKSEHFDISRSLQKSFKQGEKYQRHHRRILPTIDRSLDSVFSESIDVFKRKMVRNL